MQEELESLLSRLITTIDEKKFDDRVVSYEDFKSKYVVLKPSVKVDVELTNGKKFKIDITDYFEGVAK